MAALSALISYTQNKERNFINLLRDPFLVQDQPIDLSTFEVHLSFDWLNTIQYCKQTKSEPFFQI